jgi:hypothetical protein
MSKEYSSDFALGRFCSMASMTTLRESTLHSAKRKEKGI